MSIIQNIRDKAAPLVIILIGISLVGFILMDALVGKSSGFFNNGSKVGSINGKSVEYKELNAINDFQEGVRGSSLEEKAKLTNTQKIWGVNVAYESIKEEADKLGLTVTDLDLNEALINPTGIPTQFVEFMGLIASKQGQDGQPNPNYEVEVKNFAKNRTKYLSALVKKQEAFLKQNKLSDDYEPFVKFKRALSPEIFEKANIEPLKKVILIEKYLNLTGKVAYVPNFMAEANYTQSTQLVNMQYVKIPYSSISDSAIGKITDEEINSYLNNRKDVYRQLDNKAVAYVSFDAFASATDSASLKATMEAKRAEFNQSTDGAVFLSRAGSTTTYDSTYKTKKQLGFSNIDSIVSKGSIVGGPYVEGANFIMTKVYGTKAVPDSVRARHILVRIEQAGSDANAKAFADSLLNQIKSGASFDSLAKKNGVDGTKDKGGDLGYFTYEGMIPEFSKYCFNNPIGSKDVIRTREGYHIVEVTGNKGSSPAYQIAVYTVPILPSQTTINNALSEANKFYSNNNTVKKFDDAVKASKGKLNKFNATVNPGDNEIQQIPGSQSVIKDFVNGADAGDISKPIKVGDKFYVLALYANNKEGVMDAASARPTVERILLDKKKAAKIIEKAGKISSLEEALTKGAVKVVTADSIAYANGFLKEDGQEQKVIGFAFNKEGLNKVSNPIAGESGVYYIKPTAYSTKPAAETIAQIKNKIEESAVRSNGEVLEALRRKIKVVDNRSKFF
jgi:peptidyl-prolyl cis-trans isomerase D